MGEAIYTKKYHLIQETPMIHFQHSENGAILRGSELKPKLDKFILSKIGRAKILEDLELNGTKSKYYKFFIEKPDVKARNARFEVNIEKWAFNYKVRIIATGTPEKSETIDCAVELAKAEKDRRKEITNRYRDKGINPMYFGNMVDSNGGSLDDKIELIKDNFKETVFYKNPIQLTILSYNEDLSNELDKYLFEFFLVTNFGTRQDKGFGCFTLVTESPKDMLEILTDGSYQYFYTKEENFTKERALEIARGVYSTMKGGLNFSKDRNTGHYDTEKYIKGYIQRQYLDEIGLKNVGSEKACIKKRVIKSAQIRLHEKHQEYEEFLFVRALLGVPGTYKYADDVRKGDVTIEPKDGTSDDKKNFRFKSPLQIAIHDQYIFFIFDESCYDDKILGRQFKLTCRGTTEIIKVPEHFDVNKFIQMFVKYYEQEKHKLKNVRCIAASKLMQGGVAQ